MMETMPTLYTCGHSDRTPEALLGLLLSAGIECLIDIRRYPVSRRHPHFAREALRISLESAGVRYQWEGAVLGGRRAAAAGGSSHAALDDAGLRAYAQHMEGVEFAHRLREIMSAAVHERTLLMCAERLPEDCHRNLVADYLSWRGCRVIHLVAAGMKREHRMHPCARELGGRLIYNGDVTIPFDLR